jgi:hypothetical protein
LESQSESVEEDGVELKALGVKPDPVPDGTVEDVGAQLIGFARVGIRTSFRYKRAALNEQPYLTIY